MTDATTRHLALMAADAHTRSFGVRPGSQTQAMIRHGFLLALEEVGAALSDLEGGRMVEQEVGARRVNDRPRGHSYMRGGGE